jgi:hypothetical protein
MRKTHGGNGMLVCDPYKYGLFLCIYFVLFFCLYTTNLEINGFISIFFVNLFISFLLTSDLSNVGTESYKNDSYFYLVILFGIIFTNFASFLIAITLFHLKIKYNKIQEPVMYSPHNRKQLTKYKSLFVSNVLSIFLLIIVIIYESNIQTSFTTIQTVLTQLFLSIHTTNTNISIIFTKSIKYILSFVILGISGYILYLSNSLSRMRLTNLINTRKNNMGNKLPPMKPIPPNSWKGYDIKRYFTPQYIINYKWS